MPTNTTLQIALFPNLIVKININNQTELATVQIANHRSSRFYGLGLLSASQAFTLFHKLQEVRQLLAEKLKNKG